MVFSAVGSRVIDKYLQTFILITFALLDYHPDEFEDARIAMPELSIRVENDLSEAAFVDILRRSTLDERRPVDEPDTITRMLRNADLIATARNEQGLLVGVARAITDYAYCTYLSDLAVDVAYQRQGIGQRLLRLIHREAGEHTTLILLAAPKAQSYYPHLGMQQHPSCWIVPRKPKRPQE